MRIRITRTPPPSYGIDGADLRVGRIYNLEWSLASALLCDGCAEYFRSSTDPTKESGINVAWPFRFPDEAAKT
jgi:hypothetical protein